ncbi:MAG: long-chain fatty acid--CoA ligase [Bryobacterales bacterium]|nr:long-chain fatty acid--CoA ligase [Bryobacterales bacterium]
MSVCSEKPWLKHYDFWVPSTANYPRQSLYQILSLAASFYGDRPAAAFRGEEITWSEVKRRADRFATALSRMGIAKGDRVGIMLPNCPQYLISIYAILRLGAIVTNVNPAFTPREVAIAVNDSGMGSIVTLDTIAPSISHLLPGAVITTSFTSRGTFETLIEGVEEPELPRVEIDAENDVAVLQYTGGTTGAPKGAMLTHYNLYANCIQTALWRQYIVERGEERGILVLPMYHIYGLQVGALLTAWTGGMQVLIPKFDIDLLVDSFRRYQPSSFAGVPTLYIALLNHPEARNCNLDKVRSFGCGSAPLPLEVIERFEQLTGGILREGYGLTETSPTTHNTPMLSKRKPGSIGLPYPDTECKIVDLEKGETEVGPGEEGELCIRGPQVMKGYWNKPEETALALRGGWFYTGDVARMDEDGFFYIVQRKKDMVITGGFKVFPTEVEDVLFTHPAVLEAAVIGVPDSYKGEAVKAFIVLKAGANATAAELTAFCRERLAKYKVPSQFEFAESLPKSGVGKVLRRVLREAVSP